MLILATLPDTVKRLAEPGLIIPDNKHYLEFPVFGYQEYRLAVYLLVDYATPAFNYQGQVWKPSGNRGDLQPDVQQSRFGFLLSWNRRLGNWWQRMNACAGNRPGPQRLNLLKIPCLNGGNA